MGWKYFPFFCLLTSTSLASPTSGRYIGLLHHEKTQRDQLAKLDVLVSSEGILFAILTLHFGDFASSEYVSFHFEDVYHHRDTDIYVFDEPTQDVTIITQRFTEDRLEGELRSHFGGNVGKLELRKDAVVTPRLPLIESLWGIYDGSCENQKSVLSLQTYRSTDELVSTGSPFSAYHIRGQLGHEENPPCDPEGKNPLCVNAIFHSGSYNFFRNRLKLYGPQRNLNCVLTSQGIQCGKCEWTRRQKTSQRNWGPLTSKSLFASHELKPLEKGSETEISGEYTGYVHHEYLDQYQLGSLNFIVYPGPQALILSATGSLYFGDIDSAEFLPYRFTPRPFPNPSQLFILGRPETQTDALIEIDFLDKQTVTGTWYSIRFGRVGRFHFTRDQISPLPREAVAMQPVGGFYESEHFEMDLVVGLGKAHPNTKNPFFPLSFEGRVRSRGIHLRSLVTGGSFDFYTGRIAIETENHGAFVGQRNRGGELVLKRTVFPLLTPFVPMERQNFLLTSSLWH